MAGFHTKTFMKHDDYMTPKYAWENIKEYIPKDKVIWEAFYGNGNSGRFLTELGFNVIHQEIDFFNDETLPEYDIIVSNPPFSLSKEVMNDKYEVVGVYKHIQVRTATVVKEDDVELSRTFHRKVLTPDMDVSGEPQEVQDMASALWTDAVKEAWATKQAEDASGL